MVVFLIYGCKSSAPISEKKSISALKKFLAQHEKTFTPSDYDADVSFIKTQDKKLETELEAANVLIPAIPETIPGYRIQILFTQEIDQANLMKDSISKVLADEWVYLVYDSPYYKIRVGNFADRPAADQIMKKLVGLGFKDSWIVPDNVLKNPPSKLPEIFIEPEKPFK